MSDNRKKKGLNMKLEITKILSKNPKQAKDLREKLKQKGIDYSRVGLNDLLNLMIDSGDIERIILDNNPYPVYSVTKKSQIRAEIQGRLFQACSKMKNYC